MAKKINKNDKTELGTGTIFGNTIGGIGSGKAKGAGGYGVNQKNAKPATGSPTVNPFLIPKAGGLTATSQVFPSYYYVEWDLTRWRAACDQAIREGYAVSYATLTTWAYESSPFIQSLFNRLGMALDKIPFKVVDGDGNEVEELTAELCMKPWHLSLRREILFSYFWGFSGLNFDPFSEAVYKYPQQQVDPINRMLKNSTFAFYDGELFENNDNLLFVQPSTNYESFLGWMQPITRLFIQTNLNNNNWVAAGKRLAFPVMTVGYPENDNAINPATGLPINDYKNDAMVMASMLDPMQAQVYPYTIDEHGNVVKSVMIEFEKTGAAANSHKIYQEFNSDAKVEIETMIYGRALTNSSSRGGNRALGEVEESTINERIEGLLPFVLAILNGDFKNKISKFYNNLPEGWTFVTDTAKSLTFDEVLAISTAITSNGFKLTKEFFIKNGLSPDDFEEAPTPVAEQKAANIPALQMADLKKKRF
jgi:hypothetical protein